MEWWTDVEEPQRGEVERKPQSLVHSGSEIYLGTCCQLLDFSSVLLHGSCPLWLWALSLGLLVLTFRRPSKRKLTVHLSE